MNVTIAGAANIGAGWGLRLTLRDEVREHHDSSAHVHAVATTYATKAA